MVLVSLVLESFRKRKSLVLPVAACHCEISAYVVVR